jgi:UDP-3-O-[3-hydroxymyristoyl] N-acetylglucosamine deacetylase
MTDRMERNTLGKHVALAGHGLHSGKAVLMRLCPAPPGSGIVFRVDGAAGAGEVPATVASLADSRSATTLGSRGVRVTTVEHLLAALAMSGVDDVWIDLDAGEPPAVDGSAEPFLHLIGQAGLRPNGAGRRVAEVLVPITLREGAKEISIEPWTSLSVDYEIDFDTPAIGRQSLCLEPLDHGTFAREIAPARTFGFLADVEHMRAAGLARGASLANTVVLDGEDVVNPDGLRWPDEFVRHKVLDLVGDLALFGMPLCARIRVRRGGHALHHALLRRLSETPGAWRVVES